MPKTVLLALLAVACTPSSSPKMDSWTVYSTARKDDPPGGVRATPRGRAPGVDAAPNGGVMYLTDGSCGAECMQWGFAKQAGGWRLVWVGPVWVAPKP